MGRKVPFLYKFSRIFLGFIFMIIYRPKIYGKENLDVSGPVVIAGNHIHLFDQCVPIICFKRGIHYMAKKEYFDNVFTRWFFKGTGCISVDRKSKDKDAVSSALSVLNDGGAIGIFPEGTRNRTSDKLLPFKFGAVSLAKKSDSYIIPFGISGKYKINGGLTVRFGKPFKVGSSTLEDANKRLYDEILFLMEE